MELLIEWDRLDGAAKIGAFATLDLQRSPEDEEQQEEDKDPNHFQQQTWSSSDGHWSVGEDVVSSFLDRRYV